MESMVMKPNFWQGKKVFVTGHTGFKGSWLSLWLQSVGANVIGYALKPPTTPNLFEVAKVAKGMTSIIGDVRDIKHLQAVIAQYQPEIIFHMAAQPLVRYSYANPVETYATNVMGTVHLLEAVRQVDCVKVVVNITSDKCYENKEWVWGYRENDPMGGYDPYSASKGCSELVTSAYRNSFFTLEEYGRRHNTLIASVRAGNVIGGGDWAKDRIITDLMEALSRDQKLYIRNPNATRPWQHVLEPLSGYLLLGQKLLDGKKEFAEAWNFGPDDDAISVVQMVQEMQKIWNKIDYQVDQNKNNPHEACLLKLDCSKARIKLNWNGIWDSSTTFAKTAEWYRKFYENRQIITQNQLKEYVSDAGKAGVVWGR
ncbi:MAG: CDP-glucose 4,6-dehydratase [Thiotrichaceae bacterium]|nr:CDP-glucose 4,6-dehydratase [Thiotrichaceae bacterium]